MANKDTEANLLHSLVKGLADAPELRSIRRMHAFEYADDANSALRQGGVLLAVGIVTEEDDEGQGYRILVGLPAGTEITGNLKMNFGGYVGEIL